MATVDSETYHTWEVSADEEDYEVPPLVFDQETKTDASRKRRFSVSAEDTAKGKFVKKLYKKTPEAISRIKTSVSELFFWKGLDREQQKLLIDAMFEKKVVKGEEVITQGDRGDYFYVIETGIFEVWKSQSSSSMSALSTSSGVTSIDSSTITSSVSDDSKPLHIADVMSRSAPSLVYTYTHSGCFGELALMYNAPRAATVRASSKGTLWAVDRDTFRHIIVLSTVRKRAKFDEFVHSNVLFSNIDDDVRSMISDTLETVKFHRDDLVIEQGARAKHFYMIQSGTAVVYLESDPDRIIRRLGSGDYFGERAILLNTERSANVVCKSDELVTVAMDRPSFLRLMTSSTMYEKMRRHMKDYVTESMEVADEDELLDDTMLYEEY